MKKFKHIDHPKGPELKVESIDGIRYYTTPSGNKVASVTSVLGFRKAPGLIAWQKLLGEEKAEEVTKRAGRRGSRIHALCEQYIRNIPIIKKDMMPDQWASFKELEPTLDRIDNIRMIEAVLYCDKLKLAGRTDVIAEFDTVQSIIDFKTSLREKKEEYIINYFLQSTAYALMYNRMFNEDIRQIVIIIQCDDMNYPQVFVKKIDEYIDQLYLKIIDYRKHYKG